MSDVRALAPDEVPDGDDLGDDIGRRFRYQWIYAAIVCCMLLDDTEDAAEVFCEHHEDVMLKHRDSTFTGIQVKTRQANQKLWKTSDAGVRSSWTRFAKLESEFPGRFRGFRFLTNHPLHSAGNTQDLRSVLAIVAAAAAVAELPGSISTLVARLASDAGCSKDAVFAALSKTDASDDLPKLRDIESRLVDTLTGVWSRGNDLSLSSMRGAARALVHECENASCLAHEDVLPAYLPAGSNPLDTELAARMNGKRISQDRVLDILNRGSNDVAPLEGHPEFFVEPGIGTADLLLKKLDAGGFSAVSCNSAEDLRSKADYLGLVWTKKHGRSPGLQRYGHVRSLVLSDAATAFEAARKHGEPFGRDMLSDLRAGFLRRRLDGSQLFDCSNEHLEGFAYSLTSECKVQWSDHRPWEDG